MTQRLKQWSVLLFLFTALTAADPVPLEAQADCTSFYNNCAVQSSWPYFQFSCDPGVSCGQIGDCLAEACPGGGGQCYEACSPSGGPCGWGVCLS
jgi:hypothetical protein